MGIAPPVAKSLDGSVEHIAEWTLTADLGMVAVAVIALLGVVYVVRSIRQVFRNEEGV